MIYYVHFTENRADPYPPLEAMRAFEADDPMQALKLALQAMPPPVENDGDQFWARIVIDGEGAWPRRALSIPVVREGTMPVDFGLLKDGGRR
jgi:hypothetical protein